VASVITQNRPSPVFEARGITGDSSDFFVVPIPKTLGDFQRAIGEVADKDIQS
jgi:hypothetical protein